jgi:hypothetical protein
VHEIGQGLLLVVLEDGEVFFDEVVDEPPFGVLYGDGDGDGPDGILISGLGLRFLLGERTLRRPESGQADEANHQRDVVFHRASEGCIDNRAEGF